MPSGCRREAGERVVFLHGCACPWPRSRRGLGCSACPLAGPGEKGKGAREKRTGHPFSPTIREMPRGTGPLVCHRSFVLTVKEPTPSGLFIFFFLLSCYRNCCVCRLWFVTIPVNFRSGFSLLDTSTFSSLCCSRVCLTQLGIWKDWITWNPVSVIFTMLSNAWGEIVFLLGLI